MGQLFVNTGLTANTVTQIVSPAVNLHGLIIRTLNLSFNATAANLGINVFADVTAPSSVSDFTKRMIMNYTLSNSSGTLILPYQLYLYPNVGVWAGGPGGDMGVFMTYDLLQPDDIV